MKKFRNMSYTKKVQWRIRSLELLIVAMIIYMVVIGETGVLDSRSMTETAEVVSRLLFFGGIIYIIHRIRANKKVVNSIPLLKEQMKNEQDERNQYLFDKSGGIVVHTLLIVLLFTTCTTAFFSMPAFYMSLSILVLIIILKLTAFFIYKYSGIEN
jgi:hypothetical protein